MATTGPSPSASMPNAAEPYGSGGPLVFDTSAWNRQSDPAVLPRWLATEGVDLLIACPMVVLELLAAARNDEKFTSLDRTFAALPAAPVTRSAGAAAIGASRELRGERRLPATDYLIAAAAAERSAGCCTTTVTSTPSAACSGSKACGSPRPARSTDPQPTGSSPATRSTSVGWPPRRDARSASWPAEPEIPASRRREATSPTASSCLPSPLPCAGCAWPSSCASRA